MKGLITSCALRIMLSILQTLSQIIVAKNPLRHICYFFLNPEGGGILRNVEELGHICVARGVNLKFTPSLSIMAPFCSTSIQTVKTRRMLRVQGQSEIYSELWVNLDCRVRTSLKSETK